MTIDAIDDAINANATIVFNGGRVVAESHCNDAVDANPEMGGFNPFGGPVNTASKDMKPGIIISGGEVYALSHVGTPEEGLDCDFAPIEISGGELFTIGSGMGEMPSVPSQISSKQLSVLFVSLNITKGEKIEILEGSKVIFSYIPPFSFRNSASLMTSKNLSKGHTYTLSTKGVKRVFTTNENFTVVR